MSSLDINGRMPRDVEPRVEPAFMERCTVYRYIYIPSPSLQFPYQKGGTMMMMRRRRVG